MLEFHMHRCSTGYDISYILDSNNFIPIYYLVFILIIKVSHISVLNGD